MSTPTDDGAVDEVRRLVRDEQPVPPALAAVLLDALDVARDAGEPPQPSVERTADRLAMEFGTD